MSLFDHTRYKVVSKAQHIYDHTLDELSYGNPALPGVLNAEAALDYIVSVLYPAMKGSVATPADLPTGVDTPNLGDVAPTLFDQRIVQDDGDGNAALYMFYKQDGQGAAQWNKMADMDFGTDSVVSALMDQTQYLYLRKFGATDYDQVTELPLAGKDAGQHLYGGDTANQNLTLHATNGDDPGVHTGFVQVDDNFRPYDDLTFNLGTATERWLNGYFGTLTVGTGTMTITSDGVTGLITDTNGVISFDDENLITTGNFDGSIITASTNLVVDDTVNQLILGIGSITSTTGAISFSDENLSTSGTLASGVTTIDTTLILGTGSITDSSGAISFGDETLTTTGDINAAIGTLDRLLIDDLVLDGNAISIATLDTDLALSANGTGVIDLQSVTDTVNVNTNGILTVTGSAVVDDITLDGTAISVTGNILTLPTLFPDGDDSRDIGDGTNRYQNIFLSGSIQDGTGDFDITDLMELSRAPYRDVAKTQPAQAGDILIYDTVSSKYLASTPGGSNNHIADYTDVQLGSPINVSAGIDDATNAIWQLTELSTGEILNVPITRTTTTVTVANTVPLPAGNYRLIGIEV